MKVSDGRKTKGKIGQKNEKAKLDKEWNKVKNSSQIEETAELLYSIYTKPLDSQIFALIDNFLPEHEVEGTSLYISPFSHIQQNSHAFPHLQISALIDKRKTGGGGDGGGKKARYDD